MHGWCWWGEILIWFLNVYIHVLISHIFLRIIFVTLWITVFSFLVSSVKLSNKLFALVLFIFISFFASLDNFEFFKTWCLNFTSVFCIFLHIFLFYSFIMKTQCTYFCNISQIEDIGQKCCLFHQFAMSMVGNTRKQWLYYYTEYINGTQMSYLQSTVDSTRLNSHLRYLR